MGKISKEQYEFALGRIEELLPLVDGYDPKQKDAVELSILSNIVVEYEKESMLFLIYNRYICSVKYQY